MGALAQMTSNRQVPRRKNAVSKNAASKMLTDPGVHYYKLALQEGTGLNMIPPARYNPLCEPRAFCS